MAWTPYPEITWSESIFRVNHLPMTNSNSISSPHLVEPEPSTWAALVLSKGIKAYQAVRAGRVSPCRFYPSCSEYTLEAVAYHGALKGAVLGVRRITRCRPGGAHGVDLVPLPSERP